MNTPYVFRKCTKCGRWLVANNNYYGNYKKGKYGLRNYCKKCKTKEDKEYKETDKYKEYIKEYQKAYQKTDKYKEYQKEYRQTDKYKEYKKEYRKTDKYKEYKKEYMKEYQKSDKCKEYQKAYQKTDKYKESRKKYHQTEQGQVVAFNKRSRRRVRLSSNGGEITREQWLECMSFFNWQCAYSGEVLTNKTRSLDHVIAVNNGGSNNIWNVVPMLRGLNSSKNDKDMETWYREQSFFDESRLAKIYEWMEYAKGKYKDMEVI